MEYSDLKIGDLRRLARDRDISDEGTKSELIARLETNDGVE